MATSALTSARASARTLACRWSLALVSVLCAAVHADPLRAQSALRTLSRPDAEFREPFAQVAGVRELRDGRVLVADARQKVVQLVDLAQGTSVLVGRSGTGPGEYTLPMRVLAASADTTLIFDPPNLRYLLIHPDGKPGASVRLGAVMPRASDARGHLYFEGAGITMTPNGPITADSAPVMRQDRVTARVDTVAWVWLSRRRAKVTSGTGSPAGSGAARDMSVQLRVRAPYPERDAWTALPNGSVAIVRAYDYHVEVHGVGGQVSRGPAVPFTPVRIGEAEKAEYRTIMKSGPSAFEEPTEWPAAKPAFSSEILAAPSGEIWVQRYRRAGDAVPVYDVFSPTGRFTGQVALPIRTRLVGFGNGVVYAAHSDEAGRQVLQRFRL